ncbi:hypothetical protein Tco_1439549 [Tanacetum coccineum]
MKEESRNIDREIALEKNIKHLDNIIYKRGQFAQTVHLLTKSKIFYDHSTKQAIGFQNPFYLKKAQQLEPKLYDRNVILNTYMIEIPDFKETLMLAKESRSKMLLKQQDLMVLEKKVNTKPVDYVAFNKFSQDFDKRFVPQTELSAKQAFWSQNFVPPSNPSPSSTTNKVEVPKEIPKVSMVNTSMTKLKQHLASFEKVIKERTIATAITDGTWGIEHTKACFRDEIIPFIKALKDIFNKFNQDLIDELTKVKTVFIQMEQAVEKHHVVNVVINSSVNSVSVNMHECQKCLKLETQLINKKYFVEKEIYDTLFKNYNNLEKHCISLEVDSQLNQEIFQREYSVLNQSAPNMDHYFKLNELKAQSQEKDKVIQKLKEKIKSLSGNVNTDKVKMDMDEIETLNIELDHKVKSFRKALDDNAVTTCSPDPAMLKNNMEPITPRLYAKLIQELLKNISKTCPSINNSGEQLVVVTPKKKDKKPLGNTKKDRIQRPRSSNLKNKVEIHHRKVKSSLNNENCVVKLNESVNVQHSKLNANSESICVTYNDYMLSDKCTVKFNNDHMAKIIGYRDYQIGNVIISRVYYLEGLRHNLFSIGQFCNSNLEVSFRQHTYFICNLEGVDLLTGSQGDNLLSHLNFGAINHLARHGLVRGLPKLKFENDHLCSAYVMGKSKKKPHKPKSDDTNQEKLYLLHMDLCGPMRVASINGKKRTRCIFETIHVDFDELTAMASKDSCSEPALHEMTPATISSRLIPNPPPLTLFVPPSRSDWDILFQPLFDELLTPPPSVDLPALEFIAIIVEVVALELANSTGSPSSNTIDQDAPSASNTQSITKTQSPIISIDVKEDDHDLDVVHMNNDPFFGIPIPKHDSKASSSSDVIPTIVHTATPYSEHVNK